MLFPLNITHFAVFGHYGCSWDLIWKSRGGRVVNGVPREVPRPKPAGPQALRDLAAGLPRGTPFTTLHPRIFHIMSFFGHPGLVKRDSVHCRQTQPVPREYHTQYYVVEVQTLVELNCRSPDFKKSNRSNKKIWIGTIIG